MSREPGSTGDAGLLTPSIPWDIASRSQRERILASMTRSCAEKSFAATTIADIVSGARISRATFYKHFSNKTECFVAATDSFLGELQGAATEGYAAADGTPAVRVRTVIATVLKQLAIKPEQAKLLLIEAPNVDAEIVRRYRSTVIEALASELLDADDAEHRGADPKTAFGRAKVLLADHLAAGQADKLPALLPEITYIALLPYLGQPAALEQAQIAK